MRSVITSLVQGVLVLRIQGRNLDAAAVSTFSRVLGEASVDTKSLVVDLSSVEFVDSSGLGLVCGLKSRPGGMGLAGVSMRVAMCLSRLPSSRLPDCYTTVQEAVAAIRSHSPRSRLSSTKTVFLGRDWQPVGAA